MNQPDHTEAITLLRKMRDWPQDKPGRKPYGQIIALLALHEAGELGLRSGQLHRRLNTVSNSVNCIMAPLLKAGLAFETPAVPGKRHALIYTLTPLGIQHTEELLKSDLDPVPA